jgi:hypothetical protein
VRPIPASCIPASRATSFVASWLTSFVPASLPGAPEEDEHADAAPAAIKRTNVEMRARRCSMATPLEKGARRYNAARLRAIEDPWLQMLESSPC